MVFLRLGFRGWGLRFRSLGLRGLGFKSFGFRGWSLGFRGLGQVLSWKVERILQRSAHVPVVYLHVTRTVFSAVSQSTDSWGCQQPIAYQPQVDVIRA